MLSGMTRPHVFVAGETGRPTVQLDDGPVIEADEVVVELGRDKFPVVTVAIPSRPVAWDGEAVVQLVTDERGQAVTERAIVLAFLEAADVEALRALVLGGSQLTDPIDAVLAGLREQAHQL